jgi:hypothetical protein
LQSSSCLIPDLITAKPFPSALTTMAFDHSRRRWFETRSCKPVPRGLPSSVKQLRTTRPHSLSRSWRTITGNPNLTGCLPVRIARGAAADELCMGLRPTHRDENRFEPKSLRSNWRGTAKTGATLDLLRPMTSLVWDACLNQSVSRHLEVTVLLPSPQRRRWKIPTYNLTGVRVCNF